MKCKTSPSDVVCCRICEMRNMLGIEGNIERGRSPGTTTSRRGEAAKSLGIRAPRAHAPVRHGDFVGAKLSRQLGIV